MNRILYFCPDFPQPSGGIKTLYRHVARLNEMGLSAALVHQKHGFQATWHDYQVPLLWLEDRPQIHSDDICVFPEVMTETVRQTQHFAAKRVVFALSWQPAYTKLRPGERWSDFGIDHILAKSPTVKRYLEWSMACSVTLIPEYIAPERYFHDPAAKQPQIAFTTRKDNSGEWLQQILTRKGEPFSSFQWLALRNFDEATYAQHLRRTAIYLPTTLQEAMHVSVLEAMTCGCLVVGYAGVGGHDYLVGDGAGQNCILVENGNLLQLGRQLEEVLHRWHREPQAFAPIIANALTTAQRFQAAQAEAEALRSFFTEVAGTDS